MWQIFTFYETIMTYFIKEIFYSLQGEGAQSGRPAVFCRFSGCNLWSGLEKDRPKSVCTFCDTDFVGIDGPGGGEFDSPMNLAQAVNNLFPAIGSQRGQPLVVCTGGEPLLQLDQALVKAFHDFGFQVALETNGTLHPPAGIDWICVSPKAGAALKCDSGQELKVVFPQEGLEPAIFESLAFQYFFLQPKDDPQIRQHTQKAVQYCLDHPLWRLSLQMHKWIGIP
jgi:7-carboxy-7-deazaguanine synthase (Cx14CxxC type)